MSELIEREDAIKTAHLPTIEDAGYEVIRLDDILALPSAQPDLQPTCNQLATDCISRQDAIIAVRSHRIDINDPKKIVRKSYEDVIRELSSAQPERKKGKWIIGQYGLPKCSNCDYVTEYDERKDEFYYSNFCPNCGFQMNGALGWFRAGEPIH